MNRPGHDARITRALGDDSRRSYRRSILRFVLERWRADSRPVRAWRRTYPIAVAPLTRTN